MILEDIYEKAKFSALLWAFSDKSFKGFSFSLLAFNWKDVIGIAREANVFFWVFSGLVLFYLRGLLVLLRYVMYSGLFSINKFFS